MPTNKAEYAREWAKKHPGYHKEWKRKNYLKNRDKILAKCKEWRTKNRDAINARQNAARALRGDEIRAKHKAWRDKNIEAVRSKRRAYVAKHQEKIRGLLRKCLLKKYRLTPELFAEMKHSQNNKCAICGGGPRPGENLVVDHDHETKIVRELLCHSCNRGLGFLGDDPARVAVAAEYLRQWAEKHATKEE